MPAPPRARRARGEAAARPRTIRRRTSRRSRRRSRRRAGPGAVSSATTRTPRRRDPAADEPGQRENAASHSSAPARLGLCASTTEARHRLRSWKRRPAGWRARGDGEDRRPALLPDDEDLAAGERGVNLGRLPHAANAACVLEERPARAYRRGCRPVRDADRAERLVVGVEHRRRLDLRRREEKIREGVRRLHESRR